MFVRYTPSHGSGGCFGCPFSSKQETIAYLLSQKVLPSSVDPSKVTFRIQGMLVPEEVWKEVLEGEERREWSTGLEMEVGWDEPVEGAPKPTPTIPEPSSSTPIVIVRNVSLITNTRITLTEDPQRLQLKLIYSILVDILPLAQLGLLRLEISQHIARPFSTIRLCWKGKKLGATLDGGMKFGDEVVVGAWEGKGSQNGWVLGGVRFVDL
ncbi:hypothetical protein BDY24DRAFT_414890 [Mrakia frigida]|uniref:uncharacterized protein n=1 Tax=Mrakia frigida TaxID=29902 RepID=UPI003FCC1EB6